MGEIRLAPEQLEVSITYRVPEPVVNELVAGACYEIIQDVMGERLVARWLLPRDGRRQPRIGMRSTVG